MEEISQKETLEDFVIDYMWGRVGSEDEKIKRGSDNASQADFSVYTSSFNFFSLQLGAKSSYLLLQKQHP